MQPGNQWGWQEVFLNKATYLLEILIWQNSFDPKKKAEWKAKKPKPFVPDFLKGSLEREGVNKELESHTVDEIKDILSRPRV